MSSTQTNTNKKRYTAGEARKPGTKDYALILSSLMSNRVKLLRAKTPEEACEFIVKISNKLQELAFNKPSETIKELVKRKVNTSYKWKDDRFENLEEKKELATTTAAEFWTKGKEKHEKAREKQKQNK